SLRTIDGLNLKFVEENFSANERNRIEAASKKYILNEKIFFIDEKLVLSDKGKLFADGIAADLFTNI
ncbi:MAG: coproporphyrinogen III oxidase, partial [Bacteroidota bacterium]|nr:coproporphyrinogen III oxidase [Bacteroidota bacterium]